MKKLVKFLAIFAVLFNFFSFQVPKAVAANEVICNSLSAPTPPSNVAPTTIKYTVQASAQSGISIVGYWYYVNSQPDQFITVNPTYRTFTSPGTYTIGVVVVAQDSNNNYFYSDWTSNCQKTITVDANISCNSLTVNPTDGYTPMLVTFTVNASIRNSYSYITAYWFNFGDGTPSVRFPSNSTSFTTTYTYKIPGPFYASVTIEDSNGYIIPWSANCSQKAITVKPNAVCDKLAGAARSRGTAPVTIDFTLTGHTEEHGYISDYYIDYGDGTTTGWQSSNQLSHTYTNWQNAPYYVVASVRDSYGEVSQGNYACHLTINIPPPGTVCLNWYDDLCQTYSYRWKAAHVDPDTNIVLRQFINVPGTLDLIDFQHDVADPSPQLCSLFAGGTLRPFTELYGVGYYDGFNVTNIDLSGIIQQDPPHNIGFQVTPGETIYIPPLPISDPTKQIGGDEGKPSYDAVLMFADDNSVAIKYTRNDSPQDGFTVHVLGINPDPSLRAIYDQSRVAGSWYLPGLYGGRVIGSAKGSVIWVSVRSFGLFLDPRWKNDWWTSCPEPPLPKTTLTNIPKPPGYTTTPATPISTGGPLESLVGRKALPPNFPPLGSLESCPEEITLKNNKVNDSCVPTQKIGQRCASECSEPVEVTENLQLFSDAGCLRNADCLAKIRIQKPDLALPFAKTLGNYFAGVIDAEHQPASELDRLQQVLRTGVGLQEYLDKDGTLVELFPQEIQDQLKCKFIKYVKDKKIPNPDGSFPNTRYLGKDATGKLDDTELMIYDKKVTDIPCRYTTSDSDKVAFDSTYGRYWFAIPLFQNDDSQGRIDLVSPSLFTTKELLNDPNYPNAKLGPFYITVPEVARLNLATNIIQKARVSPENLTARTKAIDTDPQKNLPTYGLPITPSQAILFCTSQSWFQYFPAVDGRNPTDDYNRAVTCNLPAIGSKTADKICMIGPDGQVRCYQQQPGSLQPSYGLNYDPKETIQVRTLVPNLFEIAEQTIHPAGFLREWKPSPAQFDKPFEPLPASGGAVHYFVSDRDFTIKDKPEGWQLYFYRLGGLWNARNFLLELLTNHAK